VLGLPDDIQACLFDMDGVLTKTAALHAAAWKQMFDEFLRKRAQADGTPFVPFDVQVYPGSVRYLEAAVKAGLHCAVVSSSANTQQVLAVTGLARFFGVRVDGLTVAQHHLHGKPAPDTYLDAARQLGIEPAHAAVFEDALSGVEAGRAGHFGYVVGVDRVGQAAALAAEGADRVVQDLGDLLDAGQPAQPGPQ
jgi:HAD superfamily hydrolase (TIGR01509 family)